MTDAQILARMDTLVAGERKEQLPVLRPVDAATLIIIDRKAKTPKVLMGKRHAGLKFMPGKFVFPGGRIEPYDGRMPALGRLLRSICPKPQLLAAQGTRAMCATRFVISISHVSLRIAALRDLGQRP